MSSDTKSPGTNEISTSRLSAAGDTEAKQETLTIVNPAQLDEIVGELPLSPEADVLQAISAAESTYSSWSASGAPARAKLFVRVADQIEADKTALTELLTREHGKTLRESAAEVANAIEVLRYYASLADEFEQITVINDHLGRREARRQPYGVVAVIAPWNYPVILSLLMAAPALMAGNSVVLKLPDHSPLAAAAVFDLFKHALPDGVLSVVAGSGLGVGRMLTMHPRVRKVLFTGSTVTGRHIMKDASSTLKSLGLELGGNDPAIVLENAEFGEPLYRELVRGVFTAAGQICYAPKRLYVHRSRMEEFCSGFLRIANEIVVGNGLNSEVSMGPLNNEAQFRHVQNLIAHSVDERAVVEQVGRFESADTPEQGWFVLPTIVIDPDRDSPLVQQEQFGPVIPVISFDHEDEAVSLANASEYGLAASVWSQDTEHAFRVAQRIEAGSVFVNIHRVGASAVSMPFGGFKQSGLGRGHGFIALEECSETQWLIERQDLRDAES